MWVQRNACSAALDKKKLFDELLLAVSKRGMGGLCVGCVILASLGTRMILF
jgi:hypothetical protein